MGMKLVLRQSVHPAVGACVERTSFTRWCSQGRWPTSVQDFEGLLDRCPVVGHHPGTLAEAVQPDPGIVVHCVAEDDGKSRRMHLHRQNEN